MKTAQNILLAVMAMLFIALPAHALDLRQAKAQGLVGEMVSGYLGSPQAQPSSEVSALINDINTKRKAQYQKIANSQKLPLASVEKLAGEKAFDKTASGHYIKAPGVGWKKK
jgi:Uncharacterized protein conserved in bacteria